MQRETKKFKTAKGTEVEIRTYITGGEANSIKADMYAHMKLDVSGNSENANPIKNTEIPGSFILEQEKKLLSILIVSINGETGNILGILEGMPNNEYQEVVKQANIIYKENLEVTK